LCDKEDLLAVTAKASGQPVASDDLDNALEELEHGEMLRSSSDPESGRTTYRLDHDYLTRGVLTAERRADRWHYLLEDRAKGFQDASTLWKKWKALLPVGTQCRLAIARLRGQFSYGNRRSYVLWSLARLPARMLGLVGSFVLVLLLLSVPLSWKMRSMARVGIDSFFKEIHSVTDSRQIHDRTRAFKSEVLMFASQESEETHATAGRIIETMRSTSNSDQMSALQEALVDVTSDLRPEEVQTLGSSILREIQNTTDAAQINALSRAFAAISFKLRPENAQALAELILHAIKGGGDPNQRHALGLGLSAISSQLKPEQVGMLDGSIVEAIQGGRPSPDPN
jgi:hypothetical protein